MEPTGSEKTKAREFPLKSALGLTPAGPLALCQKHPLANRRKRCADGTRPRRKAFRRSATSADWLELAFSHDMARSNSARAERRHRSWHGKGPGRRGRRGLSHCRYWRAIARAPESPRRADRHDRGPRRGS